MTAREKLYGQHVCKNALLAIGKNGEMKRVSPSYSGNTVCNNAWIDVIEQGRINPKMTQECESCKKQGKQYPKVFRDYSESVKNNKAFIAMREAQQQKLVLG